MKRHVYEYDRIIIGGSLAALLYGYLNNLPVMYTSKREPLFFEKDMQGNSKSQLWKELSFQLALAGLLPFSGELESIRIDGENTLKAYPGGPTFSLFHFSELIVFDDESLEGWSGKLTKKERYQVLDWIIDRQSSPHELAYIKNPENFVNEIYFYPSERFDGNPKNKKDILAVSYLKKEQLLSSDYSDIHARFKVLECMKNAGAQGKRNGYDPKKKKVRRLSIKIESTRRDVNSVIVEPFSEKSLLKEYYRQPLSLGNYLSLLRKYFYGQD